MTRVRLAILALAALLSAFVFACGGGTTPSGAHTDAAAPAAATSAAPAGPLATFKDGTYEVGSGAGQVKPGKYRTTAPAAGLGCYWARLKGLSGDFADLIANGNIAAGAPAVVTIAKTDKGFEASGGCEWKLSP